MIIKKLFFILLLFILLFSSEKIYGQDDYKKLRVKYENFGENNAKALHYINGYIQKAKEEQNYSQLVRGYRDGTFFSPNKELKIKYADSAIVAAKKTDDLELISTVHLLKGSLYYFYYKNYQSALAEYIKAYQYSKDAKDDYLKYKIIYQIGLVKSYLGYYNEGIEHFKECISYFEPKTKGNYHPNIIYNSTKGYLNSLHQIAVCYRNINDYKKADSTIDAGIHFSKIEEFPSEKAYFIKCKGISEFHHKNFNSAITLLLKSLPILNKEDDYY